MSVKTILLLTLATTLASCTGTEKESESGQNEINPAIQALHAEVMEYHDEVMPEMDALYRLRTSLNSAADTLENPLADSLRQISVQLEEADGAMMSWMRQFSSQLTNADTTAARTYYEDQLEKVQAMRDQVLSALETGRAARARLTE